MNLKLVFKVVGRILQIEAAAMVLPLVVALLYREDLTPFLWSIASVAVVGSILSAIHSKQHFYIREGFAAVGLIWLITGVVGALPFWFSGQFASFVDCVFESCSGFTTTGASILTDIESLSKGILFWRSFTHWMGGMGVLVLATAVIPSMGIRSHYLTQAESPGPVFSKLVPKQSESSKILYGIYCALTLAEVACLKLAGMPLYDSFIHAFGTAGTGGFSNRNASVGAYGSFAVEMIIAVFILLFSLNFAVHFLLLSDELRFFFLVVAAATTVIFIRIYPIYANVLETFRYAFFQVCTIISTTGFSSTDWSFWPNFSHAVLVLLMFCGACAGSTGGGVKVSRFVILTKATAQEIRRLLHPRSVKVLTMDGKPIGRETIQGVQGYMMVYFFVTVISMLLVSLDNFDLTTTITAVEATLNNIGPGLNLVGPTENFALFSPMSKIVLTMDMLLGRLELFPVLILLMPSTWRKH